MSRGNDPVETGPFNKGLTIREHAAIEFAKAMIGTAAAPCLTGLAGAETACAMAAIEMADALIAELSKSDPASTVIHADEDAGCEGNP
jgi:hypothetical protein